MDKLLAVVFCCAAAQAQSDWQGAAVPSRPAAHFAPWTVLAHDQKTIFTSPFHASARRWLWILPAAGGLAWLTASDSRNLDRVHTGDLGRDRSLTVSNAGVAALAVLPGYLYWRGWRSADDDARDTGIQAGRAVAGSLLAGAILRFATERERPSENGGHGRFFHGGATRSSFPSLHAAAAWSIASVVARRYPGWLSRTGVYAAALAVSVGRILGGEHFPSDVVAGSVLGLLVGRYVSRAPSAADAPHSSERRVVAGGRSAAGSAYVPLESWIYAALDRLAAFGMIPSQTSGLRPWTRAECRRQMREAEAGAARAGGEAAALLRSLHAEFDREEGGASSVTLDSVYVRAGAIAGPVLNDSFHFGETWSNDQGRPFGRGFNSYTGFVARAESGRFFAALQGEFQHAPGADAYALPVRQTIARMDGVPIAGPALSGATDRFRAIEAYAGVRVGELQISVGKQALWWGPTCDSPLSFGSNAEPTKSLKISTVAPLRLGPIGVRGEFILGKLGGQQYTWRPWFNAQKLSFKLTENLEMGFTRWSIFWGVGHPITIGSLLRNFTSTTSPDGQAGAGRNDPGDRKGGFDFRYRVPGLRNWLTLYSDSYSDDDPSPLAAPRRAAINPGLYLARVPGVPRLDLRVEAPSTQPMGWDMGGQFSYFNGQYRSGNTNYGNLLGNAVGRDGRAFQGWSRWWFSGRDRLEAGYRQSKGSARFLPGGSTQSDATLRGWVELARGWSAAATFQYERFWVPVLGGARRNRSAWVQLSWEPALQLLHSRADVHGNAPAIVIPPYAAPTPFIKEIHQ